MSKDEQERETIIEQLMEEHPILELVSFNELNLQEKLKNNAFQMMKYHDLFKAEQMAYEELEEKYDALVGMRYDHYRFVEDKSLLKTEIEKYYLVKDKKIRRMKQILRRQKVRMEFFDSCYKGLKQMGWNMNVYSQNERRGL